MTTTKKDTISTLSNGTRLTSNKPLKEMFNIQWKNGNIKEYMQSVKRRAKEMYGYDLEFSNEDEFLKELKKYKLLEIIKK